MKLFEKRPLSLILCIMLGGFSLFIGYDAELRWILVILCALLFAITFINGIFTTKRVKLFRLAVLLLAFSLASSILWESNFLLLESDGQTISVDGMVTDIDQKDRYTSVIIKSNKINGENKSVKLQLYLYSDDTIPNHGDTLSFSATFKSLHGNQTDNSYLLADGISGVCYDIEDFTVSAHNENKLPGLLYSIRGTITDRLIAATNEETGGLLSSLLIGDKSHLNPSTSLLFRRIGISHILALSGMHLAIITLAVSKFLSFVRVKKKTRIALTIAFTLAYMTAVGFAPSITRAGVMLIIYNLLFLLRRSHDSFTALTIAVFMIVLVTPYSVYDLSLWLSAFATFGIICFAEMSEKRSGKLTLPKRLLHFIINSLLCSVFAIGTTLIFTVSKFDTISILSVVSTLIFSVIIQFFIYAGILLLIFGNILGFGKIMIFIADHIKLLADYFGSIEWALASNNFAIVKILTAVFTVMIFMFFIFEVKHKRIVLSVIFLIFISIFATSSILTSTVRNSESIIYFSAEYKNNFIVKSNGEVTVIIPDDISASISRQVRNRIENEKITHVNQIILSGYSDNLDSNMQLLIGNIMVDYILIPEPLSEREMRIAEETAVLLSEYSSTLRFYEQNEEVAMGDYEFELLHRTLMVEDGRTQCAVRLSDGINDYFYFSRLEHTLAPLRVYEAAKSAHTVIIGNQNEKDQFDIYLDPSARWICNNENVLDADLAEYINTDGSFELIYTEKIKLN